MNLARYAGDGRCGNAGVSRAVRHRRRDGQAALPAFFGDRLTFVIIASNDPFDIATGSAAST